MSDEPSKELSQPDASNVGILERFDLVDDAKIIQALSKRVTQGFTYKVNGKFGLSSAGVLWATREFAKQGEVYRVVGPLQISPCPLDPECLNVWVTVQRFFVNPVTGQEIALDSTYGHKRMSRKTKRYKDENSEEFEMVEDPEFTTKAVTKAERNGKIKLMPKDAVTGMIAKATGQTVQTAQPPKGPARPAGVTPPKASTPPGAAPAPAAKPEESKKAAAPATPAAPASPAASPAAPAAAPTPPAATPAAAAPAAPAPAPAPAPAAAGKPKMTKEVMVQKLDAVCKMVFQTQDGAVARHKLALLTGKTTPTDLSEDEIKKLGNAINAVAKNTAMIMANNIVKTSDSSILWKGPEVAAPPAPEAPAEPAKEEEMF